MAMQVFDRILKRDDVRLSCFIDGVDQGGKRRTLTAAGRSRHQDQTVFFSVSCMTESGIPSSCGEGTSVATSRIASHVSSPS